jgi:hypothetical protein
MFLARPWRWNWFFTTANLGKQIPCGTGLGPWCKVESTWFPGPFLPGIRRFWLGATPEGGPIAAGVCTGARRCCAGWRLPRKGVAGRGCAARPWGNPLRSWSRWRRGCCAERPLPQWRAADPGQRRLGAAVDRSECFDTVGKGTLSVNRSPAAAA